MRLSSGNMPAAAGDDLPAATGEKQLAYPVV
jgi:hypothetical protein